MVQEWILLEGVGDLDFKIEVGHLASLMATLRMEPEMQSRIKSAEATDPEVLKILQMDKANRKANFQVSEDGTLRFRG